jgi:hypothetical protein
MNVKTQFSEQVKRFDVSGRLEKGGEQIAHGERRQKVPPLNSVTFASGSFAKKTNRDILPLA